MRRALHFAVQAAVIVVVFFVLKKTIVVRFYPVCVSAVFLCVFGFSLLGKESAVFRLACLQDKSILTSVNKERIRRYCTKVTAAWCVFFVANGSVALWTALKGTDRVWSIYNGIIAYFLMGAMFAVEFMIRRRVNSKMPQIHTITKFNASSWEGSHVMCFEGAYSGGEGLFRQEGTVQSPVRSPQGDILQKSGGKKTWRDFLVDTAKLRSVFGGENSPKKWVLHCDDYWYFLCAFVALLQCKKTVALTQNTTEQFLKEVREEGDGFATDLMPASCVGGCEATNIAGETDAVFVPDALAKCAMPSEAEIMSTPQIDADETEILMFTSGSTGHAKAVQQRMTEFEADNAFVISKWGEEFAKRALVSTVSAHHIYGFLFAISLPFALGVPFRRRRVEYPEEFEAMNDSSYMIIAVPAFLKRTVLSESKLPMKAPFIFTSGGVLPFDVAEKTERVFGAWPLEVYGSTETSGIAWRKSKDTMNWTPFDNAKVWKGEDGCLVIVSPYIKDPKGFATSDLVEMNADGTFTLLGRADSIVKIEEKRVSLAEVEARLMQTGLVSDVKVVAMEGKRQYLAAVLVLNEDGKAKFAGGERAVRNRYFHDALMHSLEGVVIPKRWRYVDAIPCDTQGKKHKEDIIALFENLHSITDEVVIERSTEETSKKMVQLEFTIPAESDFFDGHFPEFHLLPAVAQFEVVTRFAKKYFGTQRYVPCIRRIKFSAPILPDTCAALRMEYDQDKGSISYSLWDAKKGNVYSSGTFSALPETPPLK